MLGWINSSKVFSSGVFVWWYKPNINYKQTCETTGVMGCDSAWLDQQQQNVHLKPNPSTQLELGEPQANVIWQSSVSIVKLNWIRTTNNIECYDPLGMIFLVEAVMVIM